ncbi:MAG: molecular chaperone DnaJ, partial [Planctomycetes bacterium]|nr:molecular chaperone DnaJ [Planctomycetota bacterium]
KVKPPVVRCLECRGSGHGKGALTCLACRGIGVVSVPEDAGTCPHCHGTGEEGVFYCTQCHGQGIC